MPVHALHRAFTVTTTYETVNITCAMTIVAKPVLTDIVRNSASSAAPITTSGVDSGRKTKIDRRAPAAVAHERHRHEGAERDRDQRRDPGDQE